MMSHDSTHTDVQYYALNPRSSALFHFEHIYPPKQTKLYAAEQQSRKFDANESLLRQPGSRTVVDVNNSNARRKEQHYPSLHVVASGHRTGRSHNSRQFDRNVGMTLSRLYFASEQIQPPAFAPTRE